MLNSISLIRKSQFIFFSIFLSHLTSFARTDESPIEYLDSIQNKIIELELVQEIKDAQLLTNHLLDTLDYIDDIDKSCYYVTANIHKAIQHIGQTNPDVGIACFQKAIEYNKSCNNHENEIKANNGLATYQAIYFEKENALKYFKKADSIRLANQSEFMKFKINYNISLIYSDLGEIPLSLKYLEQAELGLEKDDSLNLSAVYFCYSLCYEHLNENLKADKYYNKTLRTHPLKNSYSSRFYLTQYIVFLQKQKKYKQASILQTKLSENYRMTLNEYKTDLEKELEAKYSEKEGRYKAEKINLTNQLALKRSEYDNHFIIAIILITLLISIVLAFTLNNLIKQKKHSHLLDSQNKVLENSKNAALELATLKTQFSETVSHELRTPLHGIIGLTSILISDEKQNLSEKGQSYLDSLKFSGDYLLHLINDVLQISKIESKKIILEESPFDIKFLVNNLSSSFKYLIEKNEIDFQIEIDESIQKILIGDSVRLSQIIINLVGNALKFTKKGEVTLRVLKIDDKSEKVSIKFEIQDTGQGIAKENQANIFNKFVQINENSSNNGGTGLGLSIVKELLQLFNSKIQLQSELGKGSLFWFEIDFEKSNENALNLSIEEIPELNGLSKTPNILIVDDNEINRIVSRKILENYHFKIQTADNGLDCLEKMKTQTFDLVLMDLHMPILDGIETIKKIRTNNKLTPVILLTASNIESKWKDFNNNGFNDYIIKPYDRYEFLQKIIKYL